MSVEYYVYATCSTCPSKMMDEDISRDKWYDQVKEKQFRTMKQSSKHPILVGEYRQLYTVLYTIICSFDTTWPGKLLHLFNDKIHINGFCTMTHKSSNKLVTFNSVSISDLTASKYSMGICQLTKIQNGSRLNEKSTEELF
jgi:hypothetical protein